MIYPPRPEHAIVPSLIPFYERMGFVAQIKKNGTCNVVYVNRNGEATFKTRHNEDNKAWTPTKEIKNFFVSYPNSIFIGELLHNKGPSVKDTLYVFDMVKFLGKDLTGTKFYARQEQLNGLLPLTNKVIISECYENDLEELFNSLDDPLDEGIVLKKKAGILESMQKKSNNQSWQVKCRKSTKNYGF